jgi:hypothetical protein
MGERRGHMHSRWFALASIIAVASGCAHTTQEAEPHRPQSEWLGGYGPLRIKMGVGDAIDALRNEAVIQFEPICEPPRLCLRGTNRGRLAVGTEYVMFFTDHRLSGFHVSIDGESTSWCDDREQSYLETFGKPDSEVVYGQLKRGNVTRNLVVREWRRNGVTYEYKRELVESLCDLWVREGAK